MEGAEKIRLRECIDSLSLHGGVCDDIKSEICDELMSLASDDNVSKMVGEMGGIQPLLILIESSPDPFLRAASVDTLARLAWLPDNARRIEQLNGVASLVHLLLCGGCDDDEDFEAGVRDALDGQSL